MKKTLIFLMLSSACAIYAQTDDKELFKVITQKVDTAYQNKNYDEALKLSRQILDLSIKTYGADSKETAVSYTNLGVILQEKQRYKDSAENLENAISIYEKDSSKNKEKIARVKDLLTVAWFMSGNFKDAEKSGLESLKIREELYGAESKEAYTSTLSMAELYGRSGKKQKSDEYYLNTYALALKLFKRNDSEFERIGDSQVCSTASITDSNEDFEDARRKLLGTDTGSIINGKALKLGRPFYPAAAKEQGVSGAVVIKVLIDEKGKPNDAKPICGHPLLQKVSQEASLDSKFSPTLKNGIPVSVKGYIVYRYVR